jgi:hypothetical protein
MEQLIPAVGVALGALAAGVYLLLVAARRRRDLRDGR